MNAPNTGYPKVYQQDRDSLFPGTFAGILLSSGPERQLTSYCKKADAVDVQVKGKRGFARVGKEHENRLCKRAWLCLCVLVYR